MEKLVGTGEGEMVRGHRRAILIVISCSQIF